MAKVDAFCNLIPVINWTDEAAKVYGNIRMNLELQGMPLASMDLLIAASAVSERAVLVTNNMAHCGSPQKLDNLNRCKMACKLKQKGPFYEKVLRQQIQESRSA